MPKQIAPIICKVCDTGQLFPKRINKFGGFCALAGVTIAIPSLFVSFVASMVAVSLLGENNGEGSVVRAIMIAALAFVLGGFGYFLAHTKKVLKCDNCGATVDAL